MKPELYFEQFYQALAQYLLKENLVNKLEFNSKHLVVHESCSGLKFEFVLNVNQLLENGGKNA